MQKQRMLMLVAGVVLALMAVVILKKYIDQQKQVMEAEVKKKMASVQAAAKAAQTQQVIVAKKDIPAGSMVEPSNLELAKIPEQYLQPQAVSSYDRIEGMIAITNIPKGDQITMNKLAYAKQLSGLAEITPPGKRAVTISVDGAASLAGMIKPGDYVDVIGMLTTSKGGKKEAKLETVSLFQNVLVLAVGQETTALPKLAGSQKKEDKKEASLITLALSPHETNLIAFVQEQGKIRLVLRSLNDSEIETTQRATWDALFKYINSKEVSATVPRVEMRREEIEVYRGLNKERMPLSE